MKKFLALFLTFSMLGASLLGCASETPSTTTTPAADTTAVITATTKAGTDETTVPATTPPKVACLLNGNLGDKSFFDSSNEGMNKIRDELGCEIKVIEMGFDNTKWEPTLLDISDQDYDIIIVGTWQMQEILQKVAPQYPDKKYIIFDSSVDYTLEPFENVYSITFKQNEASYLAGALASMIAGGKDLPLSNGKNIISAVAGMDIPVINDFLVGYIQGAKDNDPETKVVVSYVGDFNDTAKAKELALSQYKLGSSIGFNVAAQAGLGLIDAAKSENLYAIGVDADQALSMQETSPEASALIVTSVLKNIDNVILRSVKMHMDGTLPYGSSEALGMQELAVGLADNEIFQGLATQAMKDKIVELQSKIEKGEITVLSAFDMTTEEITALKESVQP